MGLINYWTELVATQQNEVFRWTDQEWAVLSRLFIRERIALCQRARKKKRTLVEQMEQERLL